MNIYEIINENPFLSFALACLLLVAIAGLCSFPFKTIHRYLRSRDIQKHGWPPAHCDADGDFKKEDDK